VIVEFLDRPVPPSTVPYRRSLGNSRMYVANGNASLFHFILYSVIILKSKGKKMAVLR
jgi:hypothetical protein